MLSEAARRAIGQRFVFGFHGNTEEPSEDIVRLVKDYYLGSIIIFKRNIASLEQLRQLIINLQTIAKDAGHERPLLIGIDQENGLVSAFSSTADKVAGTQFPGAMALAATGSTDLAHQVSKATAEELHAIGINWVYSPVADVNTDSRNPVIGVRSYGDDPQEVSKYVQAVSGGLNGGQVAPCAKHFPGHGDTHVDSHLGLPIIKKSMDELESTELVPFVDLVSKEHNISSIMTAHVSLPNAYEDDTPASLSPDTIKLLRGKLKYDGVVVTDCLEMEAIVEYCGSPHGALRALHAGTDIAMICHRIDRQEAAIGLVCQKLENGSFANPTEWEESAQRIAKLKDRYAGSWADVLTRRVSQRDLSDMLKKHAELSRQVYSASTTVIRDPAKILPLGTSGDNRPIILLTPKPDSINLAVDEPVEEGLLMTSDKTVRNTAGPSYNAFAKSFTNRHPTTKHVVYHAESKRDEVLSTVKGASAVILALRSADRTPWQRDILSSLSNSSEKEGVPLILVSTYTPYDLLGAKSQYTHLTWLCTYEFTSSALEAATAVIIGEQKASGRLPVRIDGA